MVLDSLHVLQHTSAKPFPGLLYDRSINTVCPCRTDPTTVATALRCFQSRKPSLSGMLRRHFTLQREVAGFGVGMVIVEVLNSPINGDGSLKTTLVVVKNCLNL